MFQDRWYQTEADQALFDYFAERKGAPGNPVIALPTGTGKSVVIANFVKRVFKQFPYSRVLMLTHVKELIEQNASKLLRVWPTAPLGINSAGLNQRDLVMPIIYGGVKSVINSVPALGHRDLLIIDEAQLLSPNSETMYQQIIAQLLITNPFLKVIGFTATPFRLKQGMITDDGIFTDICYDVTNLEGFNRLIAEGFICPPIPKRTDTFIDTSNVGISGGEFIKSALEAAADKDEITFAAVKESISMAEDRGCWLFFGSGINHAEHLAEMLRVFGINAACVHSKLTTKENDQRIKDFKTGKLRALVNMGKLTTGFDHPPIDFIGALNPTMSPGKWVQIVGRGTRPYNPEFADYIPGFDYIKKNCRVADFARNTERCGPINDPVIPRKPGKGGGDAPIRICPDCETYNHTSARFCVNCGHAFSFESKLVMSASNTEIIKPDAAVVKYFPVSFVVNTPHEKVGSATMIRTTYHCGMQQFSEYINFESPSPYVVKRAKDWWRQRHHSEPPQFNYQALQMAKELRRPKFIYVRVDTKYPEIQRYEF